MTRAMGNRPICFSPCICIPRIVRPDYADDALYTDLALKAIQGWEAWNVAFGEELYHRVGILYLKATALEVLHCSPMLASVYVGTKWLCGSVDNVWIAATP